MQYDPILANPITIQSNSIQSHAITSHLVDPVHVRQLADGDVDLRGQILDAARVEVHGGRQALVSHLADLFRRGLVVVQEAVHLAGQILQAVQLGLGPGQSQSWNRGKSKCEAGKNWKG